MKKKYAPSPLISIIVPMYNVEKYIVQCIDSITNQSHKNIEVLLIDDGSPDNSGSIADEYSKKDTRIKVLHIENKGVSAARNLGINKSTGEYIVFVDGDDYLAVDYIEYMYSLIIKTGSDFVISKNCFKFPSDDQQIENDKIETYTPEEAATALLYPGFIDIGSWNKMFNRGFLIKNKITFPEEFYMGEGLNFIITAAQLSKCVGVGKKRVYFYRRDNINSATTALSIPKYINALAAIDNIEKNSTIQTNQFRCSLKHHRCLTTFAALCEILASKSKKDYQKEYKHYLSVIRKAAFSLIKARISLSHKIRIWMHCISPKLASNIIPLLAATKRKLFNRHSIQH